MPEPPSPPVPPVPPPLPQPLGFEHEWEVMYGGRPPSGMPRYRAEDGGKLRVGASGITLTWLRDRHPERAYLLGALSLLLPRTPEQVTFHPTGLQAAYDRQHHRAAMQMPNGQWLSFGICDRDPTHIEAFGRMMEDVYGDRLIRTQLPRLTAAERGMAILLSIVVLLVVLVIVYATVAKLARP